MQQLGAKITFLKAPTGCTQNYPGRVLVKRVRFAKLAEIADKLVDIIVDIYGTTLSSVVASLDKSKHQFAMDSLSIDEKLSKLTDQLVSLNSEIARLRRRRSSSCGRFHNSSPSSLVNHVHISHCYLRNTLPGISSPCSSRENFIKKIR